MKTQTKKSSQGKSLKKKMLTQEVTQILKKMSSQ